MWSNGTVGFGRYRYKYSTGCEGEWYIAGFAPGKAALTISVMPGLHIAGTLLQSLGKFTTGKSCLYVKKLADINLDVLRQIVGKASDALAPQGVD